jgi:hypothetical protein
VTEVTTYMDSDYTTALRDTLRRLSNLHDENVAAQAGRQLELEVIERNGGYSPEHEDAVMALHHEGVGIFQAIQTVQQLLEANVTYGSAYGL